MARRPGVVTVREAQARLADVARAQHGVFGARDLDELGVGVDELNELVRRGSVRRVGPQSYRMAGAPASWRGDLAAGLHALGPHAVVSYRAAAQLHGFDRFRWNDLEFTVRRRRRGAFFLDAVVHTSLTLPDSDTCTVDGLRATTTIRTIIDLAGSKFVSTERLEAAVDSALRLRVATADEIAQRLRELRGSGRAGVRRLDEVLATSGGESFLERAFLKLVDSAGLPRPVTQVEHRERGVHIARVDFLYPEEGVVVEVSGGRGHSSAGDRAKDARRRNELQRLGRIVLEFTYEDVMTRSRYVVESLRTTLRSCRAQRGYPR